MHFRFALLLTVLSLWLPATAQAESNPVELSLSEFGIWDSNPLMLTTGKETIRGSTTTPKVSLKDETETTALSASGWLNANVFDKSAFNSTDFFASASASKKNERWQAKLSGQTAYDTTRTSELTTLGVNTGNVRHFTYTLSPEISYTPSVLNRFSLAGSFQKSVYDNNAFTDYSVSSLSPTYMRSLSPLTSALFLLQLQRYQAEQYPKRTIDSLGPMIGLQTKLTPSLSLNAKVGVQFSKEKSDTEPAQKWASDDIFSANLTYKTDQDETVFSATRKREPLNNGTDRILTSLSLDNEHKLNERFTFSLGGSYYYADSDTLSRRDLDTLATGQTGLSYQLTRNLDLSANYKYRVEKLTNDGGEPTENVARLGVTFRPE